MGSDRKGQPVVTAGNEFIQDVINSIDQGEYVVGTFIDLTRAFDCVSNKKINSKMRVLWSKME